MFQELGNPALAAEVAATTAAERGLADRKRFIPVLKAIEKFASAKKRPIGGKQATLLLTGSKELPLDDYKYLLYTPDPLRDGVALARAVYAVDPDGLTQYTVSIPRAVDNPLTAEVSINVAQREVARLRGLPRHRGVHIYELLAPETVHPFFGGSTAIGCLGPEVQLLDTYAALCDPSRRGDWEELTREECQLRRVFLEAFEAKLKQFDSTKDGGARADNVNTREGARRAFLEPIREDFLTGPGRIWLVDPDSEAARRRPACASVFSFDKEQDAIGRVASAVGVPVHFLINDPRLVTDRRLRRLTVYIARPGQARDPVLDIYNVADHEAVPFHEVAHSPPSAKSSAEKRKGVASRVRRGGGDAEPPKRTGGGSRTLTVATAFVQARFHLVEIWTMQLLWKMKAVSEQFALQQMRDLFRRFQVLDPALADPAKAFPAHPSHYFGQIESLVTADKRDTARRREIGREKQKDGKIAGRRAVPFYPARFAGFNGVESGRGEKSGGAGGSGADGTGPAVADPIELYYGEAADE